MKTAFERAADEDGLPVSAWLRWLGERRLEEQHGRMPSPLTRLAHGAYKNGSAAEPAPAVFIPGYGLEEEDQ